MKKLFLVGALALFGAMNAQSGFKIGAHFGLPVVDASDSYSFKFGVDAAYLFPVAEKLSVGVATGYQAWLGKEYYGYDVPTMSMVPLAATAEYKIADKFGLGLDLGYAFAFSDYDDGGGFYYVPRASYYFNSKTAATLSYTGVTKDGPDYYYGGWYLGSSRTNYGSVNLGITYMIGK